MVKKYLSLDKLKEYDEFIKLEIESDCFEAISAAKEYTDDEITNHNSSTFAHSDIRNELDIVKEDSYKHFYSTIFSEDGAHGLRFKEYDFELLQDGVWKKPPTQEPMTIAIDLNNSNPNTCCTYEDRAKSMEAESEEWDKFFGHYPVLMKNGKEVVRLNPNDYSKDLDGNSVDITSGNAGDVMIAFPRKGLRISTSNNILRVSFTDALNNSNYKYYAHTYNNKNLDKFYVGAYEGYLDDNGALRSISGKKPTVSVSISDTRNAARLNGDGYEQFAFYQLLYIQCMFLMKYKSLNAQTALGRGRVDLSSNNGDTSNSGTSGETNTVGMDFGDQTGTNAMKFAGLENLWGSLYIWIDGCQTTSSRDYQLLTSNTFGSSNSSDYITITTTFNSNTSGYLTKPIGTSEGGFLLSSGGGSSTTYFCDMQYCNSSAIANYGGNWAATDTAGIFFISFYDSTTTRVTHAGARLMKL